MQDRDCPDWVAVLSRRRSAEEEAGEDGVGAGGAVDRDGEGAAAGDADRDMDPGALTEVTAQCGGPRSTAVVDRDALPAGGRVPVDGVEVKCPAVGAGEAEMQPELAAG